MTYRNLCRFDTSTVEIRNEGNSCNLVGMACPYEQWSHPIFGWFKEKFEKGAFRNHLQTNPDVICVCEHEPEKILSRSASGTLQLIDKDDGLYIRSEVPNTTYAADLVANIKSKNIRGMSFIFDVVTDEWSTEDKLQVRSVKEAELREVCFTVMPAYPQTTAGIRSLGIYGEDELRKLADSKQHKPTPNRYKAKAAMLNWLS